MTVRLPLSGEAASPGESGAQSGKHEARDSTPSQLRSPQHEVGAGAEILAYGTGVVDVPSQA